MAVRQQVPESVVVLRFLQQHAPGFPDVWARIEQLTVDPDLEDAEQNRARHDALCEIWRGMKSMPADRVWYELPAALEPPEVLRHVYHPSWKELSRNTGRLEETARRIFDGSELSPSTRRDVDRIERLASELVVDRLGVLVCAANDLERGPILLIEGNHRATALLLRRMRHPELDLPWPAMWVAVSQAEPIPAWWKRRS